MKQRTSMVVTLIIVLFLLSTKAQANLLDSIVQYVPSSNGISGHNIFSYNNNVYILWQDYGIGRSRIHLLRKDSTDNLFDSTGIILVNDGYAPKGAVNSDKNILCVWFQQESGKDHIYGIMLDSLGNNQGSSPFQISFNNSNQTSPVVCSDGSDYLVTWVDDINDSSDIYCARISRTGVLIDTLAKVVANAQHQQLAPAISFIDSLYLVVWQDTRDGNSFDIYGARIKKDGTLLDSGICIADTPGIQGSPAIATDSVNWMIVWYDNRNGAATDDIYCARVSKQGVVLDTNNIIVSDAYYIQWTPAITYGGGNYFIVWRDGRDISSGHGTDIYGARITQQGVLIDVEGIPIDTMGGWQEEPKATWSGGIFHILWGENAIPDLWWNKATETGTVENVKKGLPFTGNSQMNPSICFGNGYYLTVWQDNKNDKDFDIYGLLHDEDGSIISGPFTIACDPGAQSNPKTLFGNNTFFVVWEDAQTGIYLARIDQTGVLLDTNGILLGEGGNPVLAYDGTNLLVVWEYPNGGTLVKIMGRFISTSGVLFDTSFTIAEPPFAIWGSGFLKPAVVYMDSQYLVAWHYYIDNMFPSPDYNGVLAKRITTGGVIVDTVGLGIVISSMRAENVAIASDGNSYLICWDGDTSATHKICSARLTKSGMLVDTTAVIISNDASLQFNPSVIYNGIYYWLFWHGGLGYYDTWLYDIKAAKIDTNNVVLTKVTIADQKGGQLFPACVKSNGDKVVIVYAGWVDSLNYRKVHSYRVFSSIINNNTGVGCLQHVIFEPLCIIQNNYPNPFTKSTTIAYQIKSTMPITLAIYNINGQLVKTIVDQTQPAGDYTIQWDGRNNFGGPASAGIYFCRLWSSSHNQIRKMILLK